MDEALMRILKYLPKKVSLAVRSFAESLRDGVKDISEIRCVQTHRCRSLI